MVFNESYSTDDAQDLFKVFIQQQKYLERQRDLDAEFAEVEEIIISFLSFIKGRIEFERKEDHEKNKVTYQFWLEGNRIKSNR